MKVTVLAICPSIFGPDLGHILAHFPIDDLRVELGRPDAFVSEHLGDGFHRDAVTQRHGRREGVAGDVDGKVFSDTAAASDVLQIPVHLLVALDSEDDAGRLDPGVLSISKEQVDRRRQQGYPGQGLRLLAVNVEPWSLIDAGHDVAVSQFLDVDIGETSVAAKQENVACVEQVVLWQLDLRKCCQFRLGQGVPVHLFRCEADANERIAGDPALPESTEDDLAATRQVFHRRVVVDAFYTFEPELKIGDEGGRDLSYMDIRLPVVVLNERRRLFADAFVFRQGALRVLETHESRDLVVVELKSA